MSKTLVIGASGTVGSELVRLLTADGHGVLRATSREPSAADQVRVDLTTGAGLDAALAQADRAFVLAPPGYANQEALLAPVIDGARAHGLKQVVLMTAMGANADPNAPMRRAELRLEQSGVPFTIIRPNWFMQNFHTFWLAGIRDHATIFLPTGQAKGSFIDARDIAAVAAALLSGRAPAFANCHVDLTGAQALDHDQVAAILSAETGRAIGYQDIPAEAMLDGLLKAGLPADYSAFLVTILGYFKAGYSERTTDAVQAIAGHAPRTFEAYARDHRAQWIA
jgi:uncharacterized protein YbjT (DUF2867 family)